MCNYFVAARLKPNKSYSLSQHGHNVTSKGEIYLMFVLTKIV